MSNVTTPASFQDKLMERIRDSIGDLIPDEELTKLIERGIEENFFKRKANPKWANAYHSQRDNIPEYLPSAMDVILNECISKKLEEMTKVYFDKWAVENSDKIEGIVKQIVEKGAGDLVIKHINNMFEVPLMLMQNNMQMNMSQLQSRVPGFHPTV
jgi:hypothetical protein